MAQNEELRDRLQAELRRAAAGVASSEGPPPVRRDATGQYVPDAEQARTLEPVLEHNVESAERAYDTALQRYFASQVDSRASQTNVAVLSPAAVPLTPYRPNIPLNMGLALRVGLGLVSELVVLLDKQVGSVRSAEEQTFAAHVPLLAVLSNDRRRAGLLPRPAHAAVRALPRPG